jgi:hypothetical protein
VICHEVHVDIAGAGDKAKAGVRRLLLLMPAALQGAAGCCFRAETAADTAQPPK